MQCCKCDNMSFYLSDTGNKHRIVSEKTGRACTQGMPAQNLSKGSKVQSLRAVYMLLVSLPLGSGIDWAATGGCTYTVTDHWLTC